MEEVNKLKEQLKQANSHNERLSDKVDALENIIKKMQDSFPSLIPVPSAPPAPSEEEINEELSKITTARHKEIQILLSEIREYDGTTDVEAFLSQCRRVNKQMANDAEKISLINKIIAQKLKREAILVADRLQTIGPTEFAEAMRLSFGKTERDYSQLSEERNAMRQGHTERMENFVKRYAEIDKKIQRSIDQVHIEFRDVTRRMEEKERLSRFLRALKPEIKPIVMSKNPIFINDAYQYAMAEERIYREDEALRSKQKIKRDDFHKQTQQQINKNSSDQRTFSNLFCKFCNQKGHTENKCFEKHPELKNFRKSFYPNKDPPKKIHELQESYITQLPEQAESIEKIQYSSPDLLGLQHPMDSW